MRADKNILAILTLFSFIIFSDSSSAIETEEIIADEHAYHTNLDQDWEEVYKQQRVFYKKWAHNLQQLIERKSSNKLTFYHTQIKTKKSVEKLQNQASGARNTQNKKLKGHFLQQMAKNKRYSGNLALIEHMNKSDNPKRTIASVGVTQKQNQAVNLRKRISLQDHLSNNIKKQHLRRPQRKIASVNNDSFFQKIIKTITKYQHKAATAIKSLFD